ncbi:hypothetical protein [Solibacillus isronensis]|uniref:hypothetical protein n=1 Tax=Solibacillus isronensis TaxID=412383 RepID=UPI0039A25F0D
MDLIIPFVSIIGVIVGFLLSTLKEWIQNRSKIKIALKKGNFNYYRVGLDELNQEIIEKTHANNGEYFEVNLKLYIFNYGKGNTAIKSIDVENMVNKKRCITSEVELTKSNELITSFNLPGSSIVTLDLFWRVDKEEFTEELFNYEKISLEKGRLKFKVVSTSINNKKYKFIIEPLSIITAYD